MSVKFAYIVPLLLESCIVTLVRKNGGVLAIYPGWDAYITFEQERGHLCEKVYYSTVKEHDITYHGSRTCHSMMIAVASISQYFGGNKG